MMLRLNQPLLQSLVLISYIVFMLFVCTPIQAQQPSIKEILAQYDRQFLSSFSMEISVEMPADFYSHGPDVEKLVANASLTGDGTRFALFLDIPDRTDLYYVPNQESSAYDEQGNYRLSGNKRKLVYRDGSSWMTRLDPKCYFVDQNNTLVRSIEGQALVQVYPLEHNYPTSFFFRYILALGRGYSSVIDEVESTELDSQGIVSVIAQGRRFSHHRGKWYLQIDTKNQYLVRRGEFIARSVQDWLREQQCQTLYIEPGSPWENGYIESFIGKFRDECLNMELFQNGAQARVVAEAYREEYNQRRPHSALGYRTPHEFAAQAVSAAPATPPQHLPDTQTELILT